MYCDNLDQENVYADDRNFISFRKVVKTMAASSDASEAAAGKAVEMISFHSVSKGFIGECGIRGGYFELYNIDDAVVSVLKTTTSVTHERAERPGVSTVYAPIPPPILLLYFSARSTTSGG